MPIHAPTLLTDLKRWVTRFEDDLRDQCKALPALDARLKEQYQQVKAAKRTAFSYPVWRDGELTQSAVGWVLSCVFVRFLEDNDLLERPFLSGVGENRDIAVETKFAWVRENGKNTSDNDYLAHVVGEVGKLPGMADLMDARHNALWNAAISPDAAKAFIEFWRRIDPGTGKMAHEFTDPNWDTRFLGDLYQDLSESARKKFALLQTPDFVEEFILDRTLDPAINTFGLKVVRMIDPTCGSGHFLLGGFRRLLALWEKERPDLSDKERAIKALDGVFGVDINPFAVAIARFRLLLAAWRYCGVKRLRSAPDFKVNLAVGDSLLHGARFDAEGKPYTIDRESLFGGDLVFKDETAHHFEVEDAKELHRILGQQYHAVVGNPPYITVKDKALNELYRQRYDSCSGKYALSVPFLERFFDLTLSASGDGREPAGFNGQITSNSFMKREFAKKLIEKFIPRWDITHVIDTSGAYIPGHGTPTVTILGRNAKPQRRQVRTVMGISGEPEVPADPALGKVWQAILCQIDNAGSESEFVQVIDKHRADFNRHPWSVSGGGATLVAEAIDEATNSSLEAIAGVSGVMVIPGDDDVLIGESFAEWRRRGVASEHLRKFLEGELVRDFQVFDEYCCHFPYSTDGQFSPDPTAEQHLWGFRALLRKGICFGKTREERGMDWREWAMVVKDKFPLGKSLVFPGIATQNHFILEPGRALTKQSLPLFRLKRSYSEVDYYKVFGYVSSSVFCFLMKQACYPKERATGDISKVKCRPETNRYDFNSTAIMRLPIPDFKREGWDYVAKLARGLEDFGFNAEQNSPEALVNKLFSGMEQVTHKSRAIADVEKKTQQMQQWAVMLQEELDWAVYRLLGFEDDIQLLDLSELSVEQGIEPKQRPFQASGTGFFDVADARVKELFDERFKLLNKSKIIRFLESDLFKRQWLGRRGVYGRSSLTFSQRINAEVGRWLLTRLETYFHDADRMVSGEGEDEAATAAKLAHIRPLRARFAGGTEPRLVSVSQLAQTAQADNQWMEAATVFAGRADFDVAKLVETLVLAESVPALPAQRYKPAGLRNRVEWEKTWELQRQEDAVEGEVRGQNPGVSEEELKKKIRKAQLEAVGDIPVPPKYGSGDFLKSSYWKLRGKLDVPKERWVLYPGMEGGHDTSPVISWAGWDHAQQAQALTGFYQQATDTWGWEPPKLARLLAALKDLLPWLHQWHKALDPTFGDRPCDSFQSFYDTERHTLRMTDEEIEVIRMGE